MKKRNGFAIIVVIVSLILIGNFVGMQNNSIVKKNTPESEKTSEINTTIKEETPVSSTSETVTYKTDSDRTTYSTTHLGQNYDYKSKKYKSGNSNSVKTYDLYDVQDFDDPDDFAEEWAEEFGDGDYDDGYDDAYDYWEDEAE